MSEILDGKAVSQKIKNDLKNEVNELKRNGIYYPIKIDYYKIEEEVEKENGKKYGIEIVKTEYLDNKEKIETNKMYELSNKEKQIDEILRIFKENEVTPITAEEIISDLFVNI